MGVPASHPPLGSLPADLSFQEGGETRRRRPPAGSAVPPTRPAFTPRETRGAEIIDGIVGQPIIRTCSPASRLRRCRAAPPPAASAWTPAPRALRNGQLPDDAGPRLCHTATAPARVRSAATAERRSSLRRRVSLPAGPQGRFRTVGRGSHPQGRSAAEDGAAVDGRGRPCASGRRRPPGAHHPVGPSGPARAASTARPNRRGDAPHVSPGSRGRSPSPAPMYNIG